MNFDEAFERLIGHEGSYTPGVDDPGGETNWGISKRSYPDVDIATLTREAAAAIYQRDFWFPLVFLPDAILYQAFDFAVNSGIQTAIRKLQHAIGVADDGFFGPISQAKIRSMNERDVLLLYLAERLEFWTSLSTWKRFGKGWARRAAQNLRYAAQDHQED